MSQVKPGYKTTEFWVATATSLVGIVAASGVHLPDAVAPVINATGTAVQTVSTQEGPWYFKIAGFLMAAIASWGYSRSRGTAKAAKGGNSPADGS